MEQLAVLPFFSGWLKTEMYILMKLLRVHAALIIFYYKTCVKQIL